MSLKSLSLRLKDVAPDLKITIDPGEFTGFEFQTGIGFSLFVRGVRGELGRGGRYLVGGAEDSEPATGFSLYLDSLMRGVAGDDGHQIYILPVRYEPGRAKKITPGRIPYHLRT